MCVSACASCFTWQCDANEASRLPVCLYAPTPYVERPRLDFVDVARRTSPSGGVVILQHCVYIVMLTGCRVLLLTIVLDVSDSWRWKAGPGSPNVKYVRV